MSKNIIFCADGTWNAPGQDENRDGTPDCTNVYKTFLALAGELEVHSLLDAGEQEKTLRGAQGVEQVAKYIHGVGDSRNPITRLMGGATGAGTIARIVRGYTFISRNHQPGDRIYIVGFSRGAYTARALAGMICSQGLLKNISYKDADSREMAYRRAAQVWYRYAESSKRGSMLERLVSAVADLPGFVSRNTLQASDLQPVDAIAAVGVWDTVGALGIPDIFGDGFKRDGFQFTDKALNPKVKHAFHAVALDERRSPFEPTLWQPEPRIKQAVFPGAHADVGGGYAESGLSDIALAWMLENLQDCGVNIKAPELQPDPGATAHEPWENMLYAFKQQHRAFAPGTLEHPAVAHRCALKAVKPAPGKPAVKYQPRNRPGGQ
jgi:uncharacterized protein (DUF2235 family)